MSWVGSVPFCQLIHISRTLEEKLDPGHTDLGAFQLDLPVEHRRSRSPAPTLALLLSPVSSPSLLLTLKLIKHFPTSGPFHLLS